MAKKPTVRKNILIDGELYFYVLRRSRRARNILLQVKEDGRAEVVVPWRVPYREGERFIAQKRDWLVKALAKRESGNSGLNEVVLKSGLLLPVFGDVRRLIVNYEKDRKRARWIEEGDELKVLVAEGGQVRKVVVRWYKNRAHEYFIQKVALLASQVGVNVKKVAVSDARSQWGSCNSRSGRLSLRWSLALAPRAIVDYVIAHEVAHMLQKNHAKKFWDKVRELDPNCEQHRKWLHENGQRLVI